MKSVRQSTSRIWSTGYSHLAAMTFDLLADMIKEGRGNYESYGTEQMFSDGRIIGQAVGDGLTGETE